MPADRRTVARGRSGLNPPQYLAIRRRRGPKHRATFANACKHRPEILEILAGRWTVKRPKKASWGKPTQTPTAVRMASQLVTDRPELFRTRTAAALYIELAKRLSHDGRQSCWPIWMIQGWLGGVCRATASSAIKDLTLNGPLPLILHSAGRPGQTGSYAFVVDPFKLRVEQERSKTVTRDRREKCRHNRHRRRNAGSTAAACQRTRFNANWMLPTTDIESSDMEALSQLYPAPAVPLRPSVPLRLPAHHLTASQLRDRWCGGWERYTPRNSHHLMTVETYTVPPTPLQLEQRKAFERLAALKEALG